MISQAFVLTRAGTKTTFDSDRIVGSGSWAWMENMTLNNTASSRQQLRNLTAPLSNSNRNLIVLPAYSFTNCGCNRDG